MRTYYLILCALLYGCLVYAQNGSLSSLASNNDNLKSLTETIEAISQNTPEKKYVKKETNAPVIIEIKNVALLNGDKDDFSPVFYENGLMFCSNSKKRSKGKEDDIDDFNLKYASFDSLGNLLKPHSMPNVNSKFQEGPSCFSNAGDVLYLTRVMDRADAKPAPKKLLTLKIYIKQKDSTGWKGNNTFAFESGKYSYCHPTMSADGKKLYFASNMPGGFGGMDIYVIRKLADGTWTQPINLGPRVNTEKNEIFPFINEKGVLYFSSNGRADGKGGLDVYHIDIDDRTARTFSMGDAFNTPSDEFGIMFMPGNDKKGFFSSNRPGGSGGDDIYQFEIKNDN